MQNKEFQLPNDSFIGGWFLNNLEICDVFIDYFNTYPSLQSQGHVTANGIPKIDTEVKESMDIPINVTDNLHFWKSYLLENQLICNEYIKKFPMCNFYSSWGILDSTNIQYYPPGGGYKNRHTERCTGKSLQGSRHLVFMTYLNDVSDDGETEFFHQKIKIKPQKGLTLIWPADWTHTHRGVISKSQEKYILTGWYNFIN